MDHVRARKNSTRAPQETATDLPQKREDRSFSSQEALESSVRELARCSAEERALADSRACKFGLVGAEHRAQRFEQLITDSARRGDRDKVHSPLPATASAASDSGSAVAPALAAGSAGGRELVAAEAAKREWTQGVEDIVNMYRSRSFDVISHREASLDAAAGLVSQVDLDVATSVPKRARPAGERSPDAEAAGARGPSRSRDSLGDRSPERSPWPWEKESTQLATRKKGLKNPGLLYGRDGATYDDPEHLRQVLDFLASDAKARTNSAAGDVSPPQQPMTRGQRPPGARSPGPIAHVSEEEWSSSLRQGDEQRPVTPPTPCRSLVGATIAQLHAGGCPRDEQDPSGAQKGAVLWRGSSGTAWQSCGSYDLDCAFRKREGEYSRDVDGRRRREGSSRPPSVCRSMSPDASGRGSRSKVLARVPRSPQAPKSPQFATRGFATPSSSSRALRSNAATESWRDIGLFEREGGQHQDRTSRSLTPSASFRQPVVSEYVPAIQVDPDERPDRSQRPLEPWLSRHSLDVRKQKDRPPDTEDVQLSGPSHEGLQKLGDDVRAKRQEHWKRWNEHTCGRSDNAGGVDIDRVYKLKSGEFSPHFGGSRSRGRGSRSPDARCDRDEGGDENRNTLSGKAEMALRRLQAEARRSSRSPSAKNRQSWREEINKKDLALLGRSEGGPRGYERRHSSPNLTRALTNSISRSIDFLGAGASVSTVGGMSASESGIGASTVGESMDNASSSASTGLVSPFMRYRSTLPAKGRSGSGAGSRSTTPIGSPQLAPRSSPQLGNRRIGRNVLKLGLSPSKDFWA